MYTTTLFVWHYYELLIAKVLGMLMRITVVPGAHTFIHK